MLNTPTTERLRELKLYGMLEALKEQEESPEYRRLNFEERLGLIVDREYALRQQKRLQRRYEQSSLKQRIEIEDLILNAERGIDRREILYLLENHWIKDRHNIIITGPTGVGKTYLSGALAMSAIKKGMTARYYQMNRMLRALTAAHMEGKIERYLKNIAKVDVLIIDDFLIEEAGIKEVRQLFEIIDERAERGGIIMASQIPVGKWHERMAEPTIADAILDRLIHNAYRIELKGESMRKKQQIKIPEMVK